MTWNEDILLNYNSKMKSILLALALCGLAQAEVIHKSSSKSLKVWHIVKGLTYYYR